MIDTTDLKDWQREGEYLIRRRKFKNFADSFAWISKVSDISEAMNHHPDIRFGWGYAELRITNHDAGMLTEKDVNWAKAVNQAS